MAFFIKTIVDPRSYPDEVEARFEFKTTEEYVGRIVYTFNVYDNTTDAFIYEFTDEYHDWSYMYQQLTDDGDGGYTVEEIEVDTPVYTDYFSTGDATENIGTYLGVEIDYGQIPEYLIMTGLNVSGATAFAQYNYTDAANICYKFTFTPSVYDAIYGAGGWELVLVGFFSIGSTGRDVYAEIYDIDASSQMDEQFVTDYVGTASDLEYCEIHFGGTYPSTTTEMKLRFLKLLTTGTANIGNDFRLVVRKI